MINGNWAVTRGTGDPSTLVGMGRGDLNATGVEVREGWNRQGPYLQANHSPGNPVKALMDATTGQLMPVLDEHVDGGEGQAIYAELHVPDPQRPCILALQVLLKVHPSIG